MTVNNEHEAVGSTKPFHLPKSDRPIYVAIVVISDSLSKDKEHWREKDKSGSLAEYLLRKDPFIVSIVDCIPDEADKIQETIKELVRHENINFVITIGGTGIAKRDVTFESVRVLFEKELTGFGELFRLKTFEEKGTISIMTRATAGVIDTTLICCLPGSPNAVKLGLTLIEPEIQHILHLRNN